MMLDKLKESLILLDWYETIGKEHYLRYGKNIDYAQLIYLMEQKDQNPDAECLYSPNAIAEQARLREKLQQINPGGTLSSKSFLPEGKNIEIEKLLRYVDIPPHNHEFVECVYVVCGRCLHRVDDRDYLQKPGSFVFIPPAFAHTLFPDEDCLCLTIKIRFETFTGLGFPGIAHFAYALEFDCGEDIFIRNTIASIWQQQKDKLPYCDQLMELLVKALMFYIEQHFHDKVQYLMVKADQNPRMMEILGFMMDNYQTITLRSVASHFNYHPVYFSRMFHENTGMTFSDILKKYKLRHAESLLSSKKQCRLNEICEEIGYKDTTQFIRCFKELYGVTPAKYHKQKLERDRHSG